MQVWLRGRKRRTANSNDESHALVRIQLPAPKEKEREMKVDRKEKRIVKNAKSNIAISPELLDIAMVNEKAEQIRKWRKEFKKVDVSL